MYVKCSPLPIWKTTLRGPEGELWLLEGVWQGPKKDSQQVGKRLDRALVPGRILTQKSRARLSVEKGERWAHVANWKVSGWSEVYWSPQAGPGTTFQGVSLVSLLPFIPTWQWTFRSQASCDSVSMGIDSRTLQDCQKFWMLKSLMWHGIVFSCGLNIFSPSKHLL